MSSPARDAPSELMEMEDDDLGLTSDPIEPPSELVAPSSPVAIPPSELGPPTGYVSGLSIARHNPGLSIVRQFVLAILVNESGPRLFALLARSSLPLIPHLPFSILLHLVFDSIPALSNSLIVLFRPQASPASCRWRLTRWSRSNIRVGFEFAASLWHAIIQQVCRRRKRRRRDAAEAEK